MIQVADTASRANGALYSLRYRWIGILEINNGGKVMSPISVPAHYDGERILLDAPIELEPDTKLIVTVLPKDDAERESWLRLSKQGLENAYGEEEEEYTLD